jgi:hypothetical protein
MIDWRSKEILGYNYYSEQGYKILVALVKSNGYDFAIERRGEFKRVNVKVAGLKSKGNPNSWSISIPGGKPHNTYWKDKVNRRYADIYLVWLPHQERFIELDGDFFKNCKSKSKVIPKSYLKEH